jgi:hypothetical protein
MRSRLVVCAQETAMCGEQQLEEMRAALVGLGEVAQLGKADALSARCDISTAFPSRDVH